MKAGYTHISFLLDASSSMMTIQGATIDGFNKFLDEQKAAPGKATFTFAKFSNEMQYIYKFYDIQNVRKLDVETFNPNGMTALNDSIVKLIDETGKELAIMHEDDRPSGVLFVILTDGAENASRRVSLKDVRDKIEYQQSVYNWKFMYLGANIDAQTEATKLNVKDFMQYEANSDSVRSLYNDLSKISLSYRASH